MMSSSFFTRIANPALAALSITALLAGCSASKEQALTDEAMLIPTPAKAAEPQTVVIANGLVIDGTGSEPHRADIVIRDGKIQWMGDLSVTMMKFEGEPLWINAGGYLVTPGFIDTHAHGDPLDTPAFENFLSQGVTTVCLGMDGASPTIDPWDEWKSEVREAQPGVNVVPFVGHGSVRKKSGTNFEKNPSDEQIASMAALVDEAMQAGCWGMTTGIEYIPGTFATQQELIETARPVAAHDGIVMSHMRSEDDDVIEAAIDELLAQGEGAGCKVHISHFKVVYGEGTARAEELLARLDAARQHGARVTADVYPYTASYTGIGIVFPEWALPPNNWAEVKVEKREELEEYLRWRVNKRNGPESTLFGTDPWTGKTLAEIAEELEMPFEDVLIDRIGPHGGGAAYFVMNDELQARLLDDEHVMLCSDGSPGMHHPRGYGSFAKMIRRYAMEDKQFTLAEAVHKMTGLSAKTVGLADEAHKRGLLKPGYAADVLVFKPDDVEDNATFDTPHVLATGFDTVLVNGVVVKNEGEWTGTRAGKLLLKNGGEGG